MISGGRRYKHITCEPHSTVSDRAVWSVEADDTNIQLVNLTLQSQTEMYDQWRQTIQTYNLWTSFYSLRQRYMNSGGKRYKHTTCEPHLTVSDRAVWSVEADDTNTQLVNLTLQSQTELYDQWRQTIQTYNLWTSLYSLRQLYEQWRQTIQTYNLWTLCSLRQSCIISGGRRYKHTTCEPHSAVTDSCMISGGRRYKHTTCEPHSAVSDRAVWSVEADDTNIQLVNLILQLQTLLYDQWRQTIQTYNLWTSLFSPHSLRQSCMISGGRRYKHTTCEPHSTVSDSCMNSGGRRYKHTTCEPHSSVSDRAVWSVEADDTNIQLVNLILQLQTAVWSVEADDTNTQLVNLTLQSQTAVWSVEADDTNIQLVNLTLQSQTAVWSVEADDTNIQLVNLILQSQTAVWSVEADDTNIQLVNLTLQSQTELYDQWRQTIQTYNLWTSLCSLRQLYDQWRQTIQTYKLWTSFCSLRQLYDQWRQTIQTYNLWTSLYSLRQSCVNSGGIRYKNTTCEPHSTVSDRAVWSVEADDTNIQLVNLTLQSQTELCEQWRQTIQIYNLWTSLYSYRQSCVNSGGRRYKHTTCEPHSTVSDRALSGGRRYKYTTCEPHSTV